MDPFLLLLLAACHKGDPADTADTAPVDDGTCRDLNCDGWPDLVVSGMPTRVFFGSEAGFSSSNISDMDTVMPRGNALSDLDGDGDLDVVISRMMVEATDDPEGTEREVESYLWSTTGTAPWTATPMTGLPTVGAHGNAVADLDGDGWKDILFANIGEVEEGGDRTPPSPVYWGSATGYDPEVRTDLPTQGAYAVTPADLDGDGFLEVVTSNYYNGVTRVQDSTVTWGAADRFASPQVTSLPTRGARGNAVADLDNDGFPDIVFACHYDDTTMELDSLIYWGNATGYDPSRVLAIPTVGAYGVAAHDLDGDGWTDLVFTEQRGTVTWDWLPPVLVLWNDQGSFDRDQALELDAQGASGLTVGDLDRDNVPDLAWSNFRDAARALVVYKGDGARGFTEVAALPAGGAVDAVTAFVGEGEY